MILYHGTLKNRALQIMEDGKLDSQAKPKFNVDIPPECAKGLGDASAKTTIKHVYLSDNPFIAWFYGTLENNESEDYIYLFKVDVPEELLEADPDQLAIERIPSGNYSIVESLQKCNCVRTAEDVDIDISKYETSYMILPAIGGNKFSGMYSRLIAHRMDKERNQILEALEELQSVNKWNRYENNAI